MKRFGLVLLFLGLYFISFSQINKNGVPFITNYTPQDYGASDQNWAVVQDNRGVMYFGNNDNGVLEFDGEKWRTIPLTQTSIVRSLAVDSLGRVFVGAVGDFGLLKPDKNGKIFYQSLKYLIKDTACEFSEIWKIYPLNNKIYFCNNAKIFEYGNDSIKVINLSNTAFFSFLADDDILIDDFAEGIKSLSKGLSIIKGGADAFKKKAIYAFEEYQGNYLIGTNPGGLHILNPETGLMSYPFEKKPINQFLQDNILYHSCSYSNDEVIFATINNGAVLVNSNWDIINHLNKKNGLVDETVTYLYLSDNQTLWLGLNYGISKIELNNPFAFFNDNQGINGCVLDVCEFGGKLFVATSLGLFYRDFNPDGSPNFIQLEEVTDQTWSLLPVNIDNTEVLLVGSITGIYQVDLKLKVKYIDEQVRSAKTKDGKNYTQKLYVNKRYPNQVYVGLINGLFSMTLKDGRWSRIIEYPTENADVRSIIADTKNNLWVGTNYSGILRFANADPLQKTKYTTEQGLPANNEAYLQCVNDLFIVGTQKGMMEFDEANQRFVPSRKFAGIKSLHDQTIYRISNKNDGSLWFSVYNSDNKYIEQLIWKDSNYVEDTLVFKRLPNIQFDAIYHDKDGITWLGCSLGLFSYDNNKKAPSDKSFKTLIRRVNTVKDSVLFQGANYLITEKGDTIASVEQPIALKPELTYAFNDITFEYASPYFIEEKKTVYSYYLEGYEDSWSNWSKESKAVFTNLYEGDYTFKVKAKNIYGIESDVASYQFTILSPWYRTIVAYILYGVLIIFVMVIVVKLYTRKLQLEKIRLEGIVMERTAEIRSQKEAIEQKNEILNEQKEEILKQKEEITSSIVYAKRIQRAIVPSDAMATSLLKDYFLLWRPRDIVSGDFWWLGEKDGLVVAAAADCTGHGVPGAFMSMLGVSFLNEIVNQRNNTQSHEILNQLRRKVKTTLGQTGKEGEAKDGMDIALIVIDFNNMTMQYSGAYNPLYRYREGQEVEVFKGDRNPIGIYIAEKDSFTQNIIELKKGDTLYIFSDGYIDQFGGVKGEKLTQKRFKEFLDTIQKLSMAEQREALDKHIDEWRGDTEQIDDIIVLGIRI